MRRHPIPLLEAAFSHEWGEGTRGPFASGSAQRRLDDLSGPFTGPPRLILSSFSIPGLHLAPDGILRSRKLVSLKQTKNCELAVSGCEARAMEQVPRLCASRSIPARRGIFGAARAGPIGASGLRHEALDHPVEDDPSGPSDTKKLHDARDMIGRDRTAVRSRIGPGRFPVSMRSPAW